MRSFFSFRLVSNGCRSFTAANSCSSCSARTSAERAAIVRVLGVRSAPASASMRTISWSSWWLSVSS